MTKLRAVLSSRSLPLWLAAVYVLAGIGLELAATGDAHLLAKVPVSGMLAVALAAGRRAPKP